MIVEPHFLTHWKTRRLVKLLGPVAPLYVLALWSYCQNRRTDRLRINAQELANICDFDANPQVLWNALIELRFLDLDGDDVIVHEWAEVNAILIGRWKGGDTMRKRRAGQQQGLTKDPAKVELTSSSAGADAQAKVGGELELRSSEKRRVEKSREEKEEEESPPPRARPRGESGRPGRGATFGGSARFTRHRLPALRKTDHNVGDGKILGRFFKRGSADAARASRGVAVVLFVAG